MPTQIDLTPEQDGIVRHSVTTGRIAQPEDAVAEAMEERVERERQRIKLVASLDEAEAEIERGEGVVCEDDAALRVFFAEIETECSTTADGKRA